MGVLWKIENGEAVFIPYGQEIPLHNPNFTGSRNVYTIGSRYLPENALVTSSYDLAIGRLPSINLVRKVEDDE